ncbi:MAG TPA: hypothetical protein VNH11_24825 [Pirellulales bacterium]|nr:hypothetical protein [Pirellulales bacterium]
MNTPWLTADMAEAGTEALWRTNPVLCIDRLIAIWQGSDAAWLMSGWQLERVMTALREHDILLPVGVIDRWAPGREITAVSDRPEPRIIGLAIDESRTGHVFPLRPLRDQDYWSVDGKLPFNHEDILDVLTALLQASGVAETWTVPERFAFRFENLTGLRARGESMTIAAALAVLDCMTGFGLPLLRAAAVVVQLEPGGRLKAVGDVRAKLDAANRECGQLSLIICASGSEFAHGVATEVWEVQSLADLAGRLHNAGLLAPLLDAVGPLDRRESARVLERLRWLDDQNRYREAADLGDRARRCRFLQPIDGTMAIEFSRLYAAACRHNGRFADAVSIAGEAHHRIEALGPLTSDDEEADAAAEHAASLFNAHRFAEISALLRAWAEKAQSEPRRFRPLTRVKLWNTLARAMAITREQGWDELFARSEALQRRLGDGGNLARTTHDRIHALLRHGDLVRATQALEEADWSAQSTTVPWLPFLRADLARLEGRVWSDEALDERLKLGKKPYSAWIYAQATARQAPRTARDAIERLRRAIKLLHDESGGIDGNICNLFAAMLELAIAARSADAERWTAAVAKIKGFLATAAENCQYYGPATNALPAAPDVAAVESLLNLVPYF